MIRVSKLGKSLGAHVVMYKSANVKPFKVSERRKLNFHGDVY